MNLRLSIAVIFCALRTINTTPEAGAEEAMIRTFGLSVSSGGDLALEIMVNGVPLASKETGATGLQSMPIHGDVGPGENRVDILIGVEGVPPTASGQAMLPSPPIDAALTVRLQEDQTVETEAGVYETTVVDLQVVKWTPESSEQGAPFPQRVTLSFLAPEAQPTPAWFAAEPHAVENVQQPLEDMYALLLQYLRAGQADMIGQLSELKYTDAARAYPLGGSTTTWRDGDVSEIQSIISDPDVSLPDLERPLRCVAYAGGRMFECFASDGEAPLRAVFPDEDQIYFNFRFSVLDGRLTIVR